MNLRLALLTALAACAFAQSTERTSISLYDKTITVNYTAASLKGQKVLGGIVPLKQAWPVGGGASCRS